MVEQGIDENRSAMLELKFSKKLKNIVVDIGLGNIHINDILIWDFIVRDKVVCHYFGIELKVVWEFPFIKYGLGHQAEHTVLVYYHYFGKILPNFFLIA